MNLGQHSDFTAVLLYRAEVHDRVLAGANPINFIDPMGLELKIIQNQVQRTGETKRILRLINNATLTQKIINSAISALSRIKIDVPHKRLEGELYSEEWAKGDLLVDVCSDDQGNFISYEELDFTPYPNSQYWITDINPTRVRDVNVYSETNKKEYFAYPTSNWR